MFCSLVVVPLPRFRQDIAVYWQTFEEAGHTRTGEEVALLFPLYVAETEEEAQTVPRQSIMHYFEVLGRRMVAGDADLDVATRERNLEMQARLQRLTYEGGPLRDERYTVGPHHPVIIPTEAPHTWGNAGLDIVKLLWAFGGPAPSGIRHTLRACHPLLPLSKLANDKV